VNGEDPQSNFEPTVNTVQSTPCARIFKLFVIRGVILLMVISSMWELVIPVFARRESRIFVQQAGQNE